jgi:hypothetical protein
MTDNLVKVYVLWTMRCGDHEPCMTSVHLTREGAGETKDEWLELAGEWCSCGEPNAAWVEEREVVA